MKSDFNRPSIDAKTQAPSTTGRTGVRHGAVAVCVEDDRYLVIRRSATVRAPNMLCFPGGHIEANETFAQAIIREMMEELALPVTVVSHLWSSTTTWGTQLEWMLVERDRNFEPTPNPLEVAQVMWLREIDLLGGYDLLGSVNDFFDAKYAGQFKM